MSNMTYMWWRPGASRRGQMFPPLTPDHEGWVADCVLCPRKLGGQGAGALPVQELAVGPARGDAEAERRHAMGLYYNCAAIVVHAECLVSLSTNDQIERFIAELVMVPRADRLPARTAS